MERQVIRDQRYRKRRKDMCRTGVEEPLVYAFDSGFATCLVDMEDALRRAIVRIGDAARVAVLIEVSLPALRARVNAGEAIQPAWSEFLARLSSRYGLPAAPRIRHSPVAGPLTTLVIGYRTR
jgi:hypothetical protein